MNSKSRRVDFYFQLTEYPNAPRLEGIGKLRVNDASRFPFKKSATMSKFSNKNVDSTGAKKLLQSCSS